MAPGVEENPNSGRPLVCREEIAIQLGDEGPDMFLSRFVKYLVVKSDLSWTDSTEPIERKSNYF